MWRSEEGELWVERREVEVRAMVMNGWVIWKWSVNDMNLLKSGHLTLKKRCN